MSALPTSPHNKSWWSRSKSRDAPVLRSQASGSSLAQDARSTRSKEHSSGSKFNAFVSNAIGKKSKKPTLTIQDPPPPLITTFSASSSVRSPMASPSTSIGTTPLHQTYYANRPPANSISTVRSYEYDIDQASDRHTISEPRTPSDHPRDRTSYQNSLLTLSDADPFAAGGIIVSRFDQDPNRLSVWSDSSLLDPHSKRGDFTGSNRMSYGSSSSNSHASEGQTRPHPVARIPSDGGASQKRHRRETSVLYDNGFPGVPPDPPVSRAQLHQRTTASSLYSSAAPPSSFVGASVYSAVSKDVLGGSSRPPLRPRGMTVAGERNPGLNRGTPDVPTSVVPPHLRRKASDYLQRTQSPPSSSTASPIMFSSVRSSLSSSSITAAPPSSSTRPLVLVRKASSSRVNLPPLYAAPPSSRLPPPPLSPFSTSDTEEFMEALVFPEVPSSNSSSLSFASANLDMSSGDEIRHFMRDGFMDDDFGSPPRTLRNIDLETPPRQTGRGRVDTYDRAPPHLSSSNLLKKAISQQDLMGKRHSEISLASDSSVYDDSTPASPIRSLNGKEPRKQRSFHHPRIPLPVLPTLRHANSYINAGGPAPEPPASPRSPPFGPSTSQSTRKRLFSGSSGRKNSLSKVSPSPPLAGDDDVRSVLSMDTGESISREGSPLASVRQQPIMVSFANMGNQLSLVTDNACIAPAWEEIGSYTTPVNRRVSQSDYVPQHIMSPADMLKLEEQLADESAFREEDKQEQEQERPQEQERKPKLELEPGDFGLSFAPGGRQKPARSRTNSILSNMSAATSAFGIAEKHVAEDRSIRNAHTPSGTPPRRPVTANDLIRAGVAIDTRQPLRSTSVLSRGSKSPTITARSSTTQLKLSPPSSPTTYGPPSLEHSAGGLPPPPRRRRAREEKEKEKEKEVDRDPSNKRISIAPFHPLSPPPRRKTTGTSMVHEEFGQEQQQQQQQQLSPLSSRPPSAFDPQKINKRRSIMRKPSFLEIEDDADHETESLYDVQVDIQSLEMESSFLDLDRGKDSFDTVRSCDDDFINRF